MMDRSEVIAEIRSQGWKSPEEVEQYVKDTLCYLFEIDDLCTSCHGRGKKTYPSTATWHGGIGGQMITTDICDKCWGSGDKSKPWTNLRVLRNILTKEQIQLYQESLHL